jgi:hypothetical protein
MPLPVVGMLSNETYLYELEVYTGRMSNAGTDSRVSIVIAGQGGQTQVVELSTPERKVKH